MVLPRPSTDRLACLLLAACAPGNRPPTTPGIDLEPAIPYTDDDLVVVVVEPAEDPDGDLVAYGTRWFQDGVVRDEIHGGLVPAGRTTAGEYWIAEVWATDGSLESGVASATVWIFNSAPEVSVGIVPGAPETRDDLVARAHGSDLDGDEVAFSYTWTVDGVATGETGALLPADLTTRGEVWHVEAIPSDGDMEGEPGQAEVLIADTPPSAPRVRIRPERPRPQRDDLRCALEAEAEDADGDPLAHRLAWAVDGVAFEDAVDGSLPGDTVPAEVTSEGQRWTCLGYAHDGEFEGPAGSDEVEIEEAEQEPPDR